ncbi:MAG TPA: PhoH family protein [Candidatus Dormibacteraeota bacterium]|nr:PhoH family protein [Candidatus Dormibacteraeota bacterium]
MADVKGARTFDLEGLGDHLRFFGQFDRNLTALEAAIPVTLRVEGNQIEISGEIAAVRRAERALGAMLAAARSGKLLTPDDVKLAADLGADEEPRASGIPATLYVTHRGHEVRPRTRGQRRYVEEIDAKTLTFGIGPAGTGKTFLAIVMAVRALRRHAVSRIVLSRPAVEAGEKLGFLPGDLAAKVDPYLRPLFDALGELIDASVVQKYVERGVIEVAPLAYMRGRTLSDAFVILDEAQNVTHEQLKMFLTRLGNGSRMVVTGDATQIDLPRGTRSGLLEAERLFKGIPDVALVQLDEGDVVRHPLVSRIVEAYRRDDLATE